MKKAISAILAAAIAASALAVGGISASAAENNTGYLYGDADLDGNISISDCTLIQKAAIGLTEFTDTQKQLTDVDGDGRVSILDATCVQKYIAQHTTGFGKTGESFAAQTQHRLLNKVREYSFDVEGQYWMISKITEVTYENDYPFLIKSDYYSDGMKDGTTEIRNEYTFENGLPVTCKRTDTGSGAVSTVEYDNGRAFTVHEDHEGRANRTAYYQYANGDDYFSSLLTHEFIAGSGEGAHPNGAMKEEVDSVALTIENGLLKKSVNTGYFVNWNIGEEDQREWTRFNGTYTALYDDDGILTTMSSYYRSIQREDTLHSIETKKENGVITEAIDRHPTPDGSYFNNKKVEFEYTDAEISPARYSKMMNYFIVGEGTNWYNNIWY